MIAIRLEYDRETFTAIENDIETFGVIAFALLGQSLNKVKSPFLNDLKRTPRRRHWERKDFANDASRRAFFAKTKGQAYQRTGKYAAGWELKLQKTENGGEIVLRNREKYAKFVGGSFARSGKDFQQRGHIRTGWPRSQSTADKWLIAAEKDFMERVDKFLSQQFGRVVTARRNR